MTDLQGDGWGGGLSAALLEIQSGTAPVPTALVAGEMSDTNLNGLNSLTSPTRLVRLLCNGPLTDNLTAEGWPTIFGQPSDAIVPRASQLANFNSDVTEVASVIHSRGMTALGFLGPNELDEASTIPTVVIGLLNLSSQAPKYHPLY